MHYHERDAVSGIGYGPNRAVVRNSEKKKVNWVRTWIQHPDMDEPTTGLVFSWAHRLLELGLA